VLETSLDPALDLVMADPGQMHQVLLNLSINARDAMPDGGRLVIATANASFDGENAPAGCQPGCYVKLTVADTGTGMDEETMRHLFEPFFTTKPSGRGTGLGLASVYGIVKQTDGSIHVHNAPGKGCCFEIHLPGTEGPAEPVFPVALELHPPHRDLTVLVVEDQDGVRRLAAHALRASGYYVLEAASGAEALRLVEAIEGGCQLVVTDVVMPGMSGRTLVEELRLPVAGYEGAVHVGLSQRGHSSAGIHERSAINYMEKPFTPSELAAKVREVMG
jgi:two-component system, cell cycle sensor histidine kinase and response regulator CckA